MYNCARYATGFVLLLAAGMFMYVYYFNYNDLFVLPAGRHRNYHANYNNSVRSTLATLNVSWPLTVVFWTSFFGSHDRFNLEYTEETCAFPTDLTRLPHPGPVTIWCKVFHVREQQQDRQKALDTAGMLVFHIRDTRVDKLPKNRRLSQPWVSFTMEAPVSDFRSGHDGKIVVPDQMRQFDFVSSYRLDSDVPTPYISSKSLLDSISAPLTLEDFHRRHSINRGQSPVLWVASNCGAYNGREKYVKELAKHVPVDMLGNCLRSGPYPGTMPLADLIRQYKFYLALENSSCMDYVSEKMFDAFQAGAIPIVSGPPGANGSGYRNFVPSHESAIYLDNYPNPIDLAAELRRIDGDSELWLRRQAFRGNSSRWSADFRAVWGHQNSEWFSCGLCRLAARERNKNITDHDDLIMNSKESNGLAAGPARLKGALVNVDYSCQKRGSLAPKV